MMHSDSVYSLERVVDLEVVDPGLVRSICKLDSGFHDSKLTNASFSTLHT